MIGNLKIDLPKYKDGNSDNINPSWLFQRDNVETFACLPNIFTPAQCKTIIDIGRNMKNRDFGKVGGYDVRTDPEKEKLKKIRDSYISWIPPGENTEWIYNLVTSAIMHLNKQFFNFELTGLTETLQFTEYNEPGGHYRQHIDKTYGGTVRKLSVTIQLTDPEDYEGGEFELTDGDWKVMPKDQGMMFAFPSYVLHRVKPVTKGTRNSLVAWISGPEFK